MVRLAVFSSVVLAVFAVLPIGLAGPTYAVRDAGCVDCVAQRGLSNHRSGADSSGHVVPRHVTKKKKRSVNRRSCRANSSASSSVVASSTPVPAAVQNVGNAPVPTTVISTSTETHAAATPATQPAVKASPVPTTSAVPPPPPATTSKAVTTHAAAAASPSAATTQAQSSSGGTSQSDIDLYLSGHNTVRAQHGAAPLTWSDELASKAQQWANGCVFQHSGGTLGPFGENLAAGTGSSYGITPAIQSWTNEVSQYDPSNPQPSHFTQVVWKATTQVGCAVQLCNGIFPASFGEAQYYVCEYSPQGNVIGEFSQNVQV